jgi:hypothetical protein
MGQDQSCGGACALTEIDCGGWFSEPQEELVYVAVLHRHGEMIFLFDRAHSAWNGGGWGAGRGGCVETGVGGYRLSAG